MTTATLAVAMPTPVPAAPPATTTLTVSPCAIDYENQQLVVPFTSPVEGVPHVQRIAIPAATFAALKALIQNALSAAMGTTVTMP